MDDREPDDPNLISPTFRNGSVTVVGLMTAFSLGFLTAWGANPVPWEVNDAFALVPIGLGLILEFLALAEMLDHRSLELPRYKRAVRLFLAGVILVGVGVILALALDVVVVSESHPHTEVID
jgi:hypothetical protein